MRALVGSRISLKSRLIKCEQGTSTGGVGLTPMMTTYEMDGVDEAGGSRDKRIRHGGWSMAVWSVRLALVEEVEIITAAIA